MGIHVRTHRAYLCFRQIGDSHLDNGDCRTVGGASTGDDKISPVNGDCGSVYRRSDDGTEQKQVREEGRGMTERSIYREKIKREKVIKDRYFRTPKNLHIQFPHWQQQTRSNSLANCSFGGEKENNKKKKTATGYYGLVRNIHA